MTLFVGVFFFLQVPIVRISNHACAFDRVLDAAYVILLSFDASGASNSFCKIAFSNSRALEDQFSTCDSLESECKLKEQEPQLLSNCV